MVFYTETEFFPSPFLFLVIFIVLKRKIKNKWEKYDYLLWNKLKQDKIHIDYIFGGRIVKNIKQAQIRFKYIIPTISGYLFI